VTSSWRRAPGVLLGALTGLNALNYVDRYVAAATLPLILTSLSISDAQGGLIQSVFIVTYALACPLAGWLGDRRSRLMIAAAAVFVWSLATVSSGLAPTYALLLAARAVIGVGEAGYGVVTPSLLADAYAPQRRAQMLGVFYAAIPVGSALGYVLGGLIGSAHGWRAAFLVVGAPGAVLAFLLLLLVEPTRGAYDVGGTTASPPALGVAVRELLARPSYLVNTAAQIVYTFALGGLATWMPTYFVRERRLTLAEASATFGVVLVAGGFAGTLLGGWLAGIVGRRHPGADFVVSGSSLVAAIVFTVSAILAPQPVVFWPAMFVSLLLVFMNIGPLNAAMANVLPVHVRTFGFAVTTMLIHVLGDAISPWLIGEMSDQTGLTLPVLLTGCLLSLSGVILLAGRRTVPRDISGSRAQRRT